MAQLMELDVDRVDAVDRPATGRKFLLMKSTEPADVVKNADDLAAAIHSVLELLSQEQVPVSERGAVALNALGSYIGYAKQFGPGGGGGGGQAPPFKRPNEDEEPNRPPAPPQAARPGPPSPQGPPPGPQGQCTCQHGREPMAMDEKGVAELVAKGVEDALPKALEKIAADVAKTVTESVMKSVGEGLTGLKTELQGELAEIRKSVPEKPVPPSRQPQGQDPVAKAAPEHREFGKGMFTDVLFGKQPAKA